MKKQLIILLAVVSLITLAQSPQRFPGGVIGKYFQKSGSSADSVLLGNGQARALSSISANIDTINKIATKHDLYSKQDTLPATPANPQSKFLNGNKQWSEIVVGSGGYAANMYPTTIASDVSGYYKLSYINEATQTIRSYTVTNQEVKVSTSIYDAGIGVTTIDAGIWLARMRMYVSSASGNTRSRAEVFLRHTNGTETTLFSASSSDINNTTADWVISESNQPSFSCLATDRLGIRHFISTDSHSAITVYVVIGNGYASYINTPLALRHSQLRGLNDDSNYQHITSTQVSGLHTHANKSALDLVSGTNTGDETLSTIKSKLGKVSSSNDGYLGYEQFNILSAKQDALGYTPVNSTAIGAANGVAPLDASAKISTTYLPSVVLGAMKYQGTYDASTGGYPASPAQGNYWVVSVAGTISSVSYRVGDWMAYNGTGWNKIDNQQTVSSVFGRTGAVSAVSGDYNTSQVTENGNLYYTDSRARSSINNTVQALTYNQGTGVLSQNSGYYYPTTSDQTNWNNKQPVLSGTGIVKSSAGTISYLTDNSDAWNTAYSWGNHASAGYATNNWVSTNYQPLENQRVSTNNSPTFQNLSLQGGALSITGVYPQINLIPTSDNKARLLFNDGTSLVWRYDGTNNSTILNTYNFNSYVPTINGNGATGTWPITASKITVNEETGANEYFPVLWGGNVDKNLVYSTGSKFKFNPLTGNIIAASISLTSDAGAGKVLTATNASGNCTWQTPGYSSGTYVPTYSNVSAGITAISTEAGLYYKIGNIVHVNLRVVISATANTTHSFNFSLPISASQYYSGIYAGICNADKPVPVSTYSEQNVGITSFYIQNAYSNTVINLTFDYVSANQ